MLSRFGMDVMAVRIIICRWHKHMGSRPPYVFLSIFLTCNSLPSQHRICYRPISQIPECICAISHNITFYNRNVHISVTKWCIVGYSSDALWDLWHGSIGPSACLAPWHLQSPCGTTVVGNSSIWYGISQETHVLCFALVISSVLTG